MNQLDDSHTIYPTQKRRKNAKENTSPRDEVMAIDQDNMEINQTCEIPTQVTSFLAKSQVVIAELDHGSPMSFQDEFIILHHMQYHKDTRRIQIGQVNVKRK